MTESTVTAKPGSQAQALPEIQTHPAASNPITAIWTSIIGKKIVMAVSGAVLVLFIFGHVAGNLKIFSGPEEINAYSRFLREVGYPEFSYGQLLWLVRGVLLISVFLHITAAYQLTMTNRRARPIDYTSRKNVETGWSALTMRWSGVLLLVFVIFHLLHFTLGAVGFEPGQFVHLAVYQNVVAGFSVWPIALFYIVSMAALCLHLNHGIWSAFQTLGWSNARNQRSLKVLSRVVAILVFLGFSSVPVAVLAGWVR
jgi:succinate dehydrogenase / fumarate reductase, cytochrome b subunit